MTILIRSLQDERPGSFENSGDGGGRVGGRGRPRYSVSPTYYCAPASGNYMQIEAIKFPSGTAALGNRMNEQEGATIGVYTAPTGLDGYCRRSSPR